MLFNPFATIVLILIYLIIPPVLAKEASNIIQILGQVDGAMNFMAMYQDQKTLQKLSQGPSIIIASFKNEKKGRYIDFQDQVLGSKHRKFFNDIVRSNSDYLGMATLQNLEYVFEGGHIKHSIDEKKPLSIFLTGHGLRNFLDQDKQLTGSTFALNNNEDLLGSHLLHYLRSMQKGTQIPYYSLFIHSCFGGGLIKDILFNPYNERDMALQIKNTCGFARVDEYDPAVFSGNLDGFYRAIKMVKREAKGPINPAFSYYKYLLKNKIDNHILPSHIKREYMPSTSSGHLYMKRFLKRLNGSNEFDLLKSYNMVNRKYNHQKLEQLKTDLKEYLSLTTELSNECLSEIGTSDILFRKYSYLKKSLIAEHYPLTKTKKSFTITLSELNQITQKINQKYRRGIHINARLEIRKILSDAFDKYRETYSLVKNESDITLNVTSYFIREIIEKWVELKKKKKLNDERINQSIAHFVSNHTDSYIKTYKLKLTKEDRDKIKEKEVLFANLMNKSLSRADNNLLKRYLTVKSDDVGIYELRSCLTYYDQLHQLMGIYYLLNNPDKNRNEIIDYLSLRDCENQTYL